MLERRAEAVDEAVKSLRGGAVAAKGKREKQTSESMGDSGDSTAPFFGFIGAAAALVFSSMGAAYGTAKSGVGIAAMGVMRPELVMKSIVPVVMAGVLGIYGFIISVLIAQKVAPTDYKMFERPERGHGHRRRRRQRSESQCPATQALRGHDSHPHFRRGFGPVRPHRWHRPVRKEQHPVVAAAPRRRHRAQFGATESETS